MAKANPSKLKAVLKHSLPNCDLSLSAKTAIKTLIERYLNGEIVAVTRCGDCAVPHNIYTGCPKLNGCVTYPEFYCALGERKAENDSQ